MVRWWGAALDHVIYYFIPYFNQHIYSQPKAEIAVVLGHQNLFSLYLFTLFNVQLMCTMKIKRAILQNQCVTTCDKLRAPMYIQVFFPLVYFLTIRNGTKCTLEKAAFINRGHVFKMFESILHSTVNYGQSVTKFALRLRTVFSLVYLQNFT